MNKIFLCGDIHQEITPVDDFINRLKERNINLDKTDTIIFLGDFCANYFCNGNLKEEEFKYDINNIGCRILVLRGNHEERINNMILKYPYKYASSKLESHEYEYLVPNDKWYATKTVTNIRYYYEKNYPNIWYLPDEPYEFHLNGYSIFSLPGAYSIDKYYRLATGQRWFKDEQLTQEEMDEVRNYPLNRIKPFDLIISHTCPISFEPSDLFIPNLDQDVVDKTIERFLEEVRQSASYSAWCWGHFHQYRDYGKDELGHKHLMLFNDKLIELNDFLANDKFTTY